METCSLFQIEDRETNVEKFLESMCWFRNNAQINKMEKQLLQDGYKHDTSCVMHDLDEA